MVPGNKIRLCWSFNGSPTGDPTTYTSTDVKLFDAWGKEISRKHAIAARSTIKRVVIRCRWQKHSEVNATKGYPHSVRSIKLDAVEAGLNILARYFRLKYTLHCTEKGPVTNLPISMPVFVTGN